jgi:hypothetical protein
MKKIIFIMFALISFLGVSAQMAKKSIGLGISEVRDVTNYTLISDTAQYWLVKANQKVPTTQDFIVKLDSLSGNHTNVAVQLMGQKSPDKGDWTNIGSAVNWKGTTADTTIVISNATATRYRNYKVVYTGTGTGKTTIDIQELKLWY